MIEAIFALPRYIIMPLVLVGYSIACLGAGLLLLKLCEGKVERIERISSGVLLATGFILGQGILASLWMFLALGAWFSIELVATFCLVFASAGLYIGRNLFTGFGRQLASIWHELREDTWGWQLLAGLTIIFCLLWITSLGRPLGGDGTAFYMALGKLVAFSHHLVPLPGYETYTNIGLQGELHFAALMALHSPEAAQLFSWPTAVAGAVLLAALGRVVGMGRRGQWLTLSILFSSSALFRMIGNGKVDVFATALGLAAYYWAVQIRFTHTRTGLLLTGLFSGFAMVAKLSYIPVMVPTIALLVLWGYETELKHKGQWRPAWKPLLTGCVVILAGVILAFIPHFVKNGLLYHNPFAPLGSGGAGWLDQNWFGSQVTRRIVLSYPFALVYGSYWAQGGNLSPLVLAFLPLALYLPRPRFLLASPLVMVTVTGLAGLVLWVLLKPSVLAPRYILATLLLFILLPGRAAEYVSLNEQKPRLLAVGVLASTVLVLSVVGLSALGQTFSPSATIQYLLSNLHECNRDGEYCAAMEKINHKAQPGDRLFLASYPRYWLRGDLLQCVNGESDHFSPGATAEQLWLEIYQKGFKYLFLDKTTHSNLIDLLDFEHMPPWVDLQLLYDKESLSIYEVKFKNPPSAVQPEVCQRLPSSTIWEVLRPKYSDGKQEQ